MPHIVLEHSDNLSASIKESGLLSSLHYTVVESGLFSPDAVKARSIGFEEWVLPGDADRFAHITVSILAGRTPEQRATLSKAIYDAADAKLSGDVKLSVNIHEMDRETYTK